MTSTRRILALLLLLIAAPAFAGNGNGNPGGNSSSGGSGITALTGVVTASGTGSVPTSFGTFPSATLLAALTNATGTGASVFSASPTFTGTATFASATATGNINGNTFTGGNAIQYHLDASGNISTSGTISATGAVTGASFNGVALGTGGSSTTFLNGAGGYTTPAGGSGTVTTVSVAAANGFTGTVANPTTTPAITIIAGAITPTSVAATGAVSGTTGTFSGVDTALSFVGTGTGANTLPVGTTGQRPSVAEGLFRDNTTTHALEAYLNGAWQTVVSSTTGLVNLASQVTGTLPVANGGTGGATVNAYYGLPNFRAKLDAIKHGTATSNLLDCRLGDSTTYGSYSTLTSSGDVVVGSYPTQMTTLINSSYGINAESNSFMGAGSTGPNNNTTNDARIVVGSAWSIDNTIISFGGGTFKATTATNPIDFTPASPVDTFKVVYITQPGGGSFTLQIGSGSLTTINTSGTAGIAVATVTGSLATQAIHFLWSSGGQVNVVGVIDSYDSSQKWVAVVNMGWPGAKATDYAVATNAYNPGNSAAWTAIGCTLVSDNLGINDWNGAATTVPNYTTAMTTLVSAEQSSSASTDVMLITPNPSATTAASQATQQSFVAAMYSVANAASIPVIDIFKRWGTYARVSALGMTQPTGGSSLHPNQLGYADMAQANGSQLYQVPGQTDNNFGFPYTLNNGTNVPLTLSGSNSGETSMNIFNTAGHTFSLNAGAASLPTLAWMTDITASPNANLWAASGTAFSLQASQALGWTSSTTNALGTPDTGISRVSAGIVGVGTGAKGSVAGTIVAGSAAIGTSSIVSGSVLTLAGHLGFSTASIPVVTTCGGGILTAGSTDNKWTITGITAATACTVTWGTALPTTPSCAFNTSTGIAVGGIPTTSAVTTSMVALTGTLQGICF